MKKLLFRIVVLLSILFIIDFMFGYIFRHIIDISPDGRYFKANYSLNHSDEDVIIFGSSRAETNYAPFVFEDSLTMTTWNTGRGGQMLPFWYAMELGVLNHHVPKIAIVNIERDFLSGDLKSGYERAGFLRPFYYENPVIHPVIDKISGSENILMWSHIYAFNSSFYYLLRPFIIKGLDGKKGLKGWKTREGKLSRTGDDYEIYDSNRVLDQQLVSLFHTFIDNLTSRGCKVFIVVSPNYNEQVKQSPTINHIANIKNVTLLDYSNDKNFIDNPSYFIDSNHLNVEGAIEFSKAISGEILNNIK